MNKHYILALFGLSVTYGTPIIISIGLLIQLVPRLPNLYQTPTVTAFIIVIALCIIEIYHTIKELKLDYKNKNLSTSGGKGKLE